MRRRRARCLTDAAFRQDFEDLPAILQNEIHFRYANLRHVATSQKDTPTTKCSREKREKSHASETYADVVRSRRYASVSVRQDWSEVRVVDIKAEIRPQHVVICYYMMEQPFKVVLLMRTDANYDDKQHNLEIILSINFKPILTYNWHVIYLFPNYTNYKTLWLPFWLFILGSFITATEIYLNEK